jgi:hypothetical protein
MKSAGGHLPVEMARKGCCSGRDTTRSLRYGGYQTVEGVCE